MGPTHHVFTCWLQMCWSGQWFVKHPYRITVINCSCCLPKCVSRLRTFSDSSQDTNNTTKDYPAQKTLFYLKSTKSGLMPVLLPVQFTFWKQAQEVAPLPWEPAWLRAALGNHSSCPSEGEKSAKDGIRAMWAVGCWKCLLCCQHIWQVSILVISLKFIG